MNIFAPFVATIKVKSFWEDHKIWKKKSYLFECYWLMSKQMGDFVAFLEDLNFMYLHSFE